MPVTSRKRASKNINDVAKLLSEVVDVSANPRHADELIDEIAHLLWAVSSLDSDADDHLKHSGYVADIVTRSQG